ncbi:MAG TPA: PAS domain-containing protein [Clostridiaceae bacterium]
MGIFDRDDSREIKKTKNLVQVESRHINCNNYFEINHSIMLVIDPETGIIVDANPAACSFYKYNYEDIIKLKISDINTLLIEELAIELKLAIIEHRNCFYFKHRLANGEINLNGKYY